VTAPDLRTSLLDLHRLLLQHQQRQVERINGRMSPGEVLQAATTDLRFSWINELFEPIAALDAALSDRDEEAGGAAIDRIRGLVVEPDPEGAFGRRYLQVLQEEPEVVLVHRTVVAALTP
jgi:hypothetical protein